MAGIRCDCCGAVNAPSATECTGCGAMLSTSPGTGRAVPPRPTASRPAASSAREPAGGPGLVSGTIASPDGYVGREIRRANRNLVITSLILVAMLAGAAGIWWRYLYNFALGPAPIEKVPLTATTNPDQLTRYYVVVKPDKDSVDTLGRTVESDSQKTIASWLIVALQDHFIIVKASPGADQGEIAGALAEMPGDISSQFLPDLRSKNPDAAARVLPFILDATDFRTPGYIGLVVGAGFLALALWNLAKARSRSAHPEMHPSIK